MLEREVARVEQLRGGRGRALGEHRPHKKRHHILALQEVAPACEGGGEALAMYKGDTWLVNEERPWDTLLSVDTEYEQCIVDMAMDEKWVGIAMQWNEGHALWKWSIWSAYMPTAWDEGAK